MNEKTETEKFIQDTDNILHRVHATDSERWPEAYRREMEIVRALAAADFSAESRVRQALKRKLLDMPLRKKEILMNRPLFHRLFARLSIAVILVALLILAVSPLGETLAQTVIQIVQSWQLGENTTAVSVDGDFEAIPDENGETLILPAPESMEDEEEIAPDPEQETGQRTLTLDPTIPLDRAQELVTFTLRQPAFIPQGYEFQGVVVIHAGQASLDYVNQSQSRLMGLLQTAVGGTSGEVQVTFTSDVDVQDVMVNGREAIWTQAGDEGMLIWEAGNVNYQLIGLGDLEIALRVAESIE